MRNKDVLKKLKNLPDNTKEYVDKIHDYHKVIDNAIEFEIANGTISSLSAYSQNKTNGDAHNMKYVNSSKIIDATNTYGIPILITISDGSKHMYHKALLNGLEGSPYCYLDNIQISFYNNKTIQIKIYNKKNFDSSFNLVESNGCCISINYGGSTTDEQYKYLDSLNISILLVDYNYLTLDNVVEYTPKNDYNPATKKYVDDKSPFKSITSTADNTITINELQTGNLYELNGTFKMFSSSESIKLSGLFIFESIDNNTKALRKINNNGTITTTSYKLDVNTQTYTINKTQEIFYLTPENNIIYLENVGTAIYSTSALSVRVNKSNDTSVSLGVAGIKYLAITKARNNGDTIWSINVLGSIMSNSELTLKSDGTVVKEYYQYQTNKNVLTKDNTAQYTPTGDYNPATKKYADNASKLVKEDINNGIIDIKNEIDSLYYGNSSSDNYKTILYNDVLKGKFIYSEECKRGLTTGTAYFININDSKLVNDSLTMIFFKIKYKDLNNQIFNDICYEGANDNFECHIKNNENKIYVSFRLRINKEITSDGTINEKNKNLILQVSIWDKTKYIGNENILETIEINMYSKMRNYLPISSNPAADYTPTKDYQPTNKKYVDDNNFYDYPTILYDDAKLPKGYVNITTLKTNTFYKVPKGVLTGIFDRVCLKAPNDDGTWFKVDDSSNSTGWRGFGGDTISLITKSDTNITLYTLGVNGFAKCLNIQKENGKWSLKQTMPTILCTSNRAEYTPTTDYHPATKKYVDDLVKSSKTAMCTDEEVDNMLNEVLGGDYSGN